MVETTYTITGPASIALLADFHNGDPKPILESLNQHKDALDLIAIAGDLFYGSHPEDEKSPLDTQRNVTVLLRSCASIAPTYLSLGNHEWFLNPSDLNRIRSLGIVILDNEYVSDNINGRKLFIGGLTSAHVLEYRRFLHELEATAEGRLTPGESRLLSPAITAQEARERLLSPYPRRQPADFQKPDRSRDRRERKAGRGAGTEGRGDRWRGYKVSPSVSWLEKFSRLSGFRLLISHHPEYFDLAPSVDLLLSGHAHGGQIRIFNHGLFAPGQGFLPTYTKGRYGNMIVSAGLTNTTWLPRLCNPTEIVYITPRE